MSVCRHELGGVKPPGVQPPLTIPTLSLRHRDQVNVKRISRLAVDYVAGSPVEYCQHLYVCVSSIIVL